MSVLEFLNIMRYYELFQQLALAPTLIFLILCDSISVLEDVASDK